MKLIACIICFLSSVSLFAYDLEVEGIYYNANIEDMELTVTSGDISYSGAMSIPEVVEYKGRTFSVVEVGSSAFENSSIESINIPGTVKYIANSAFRGCKNLREVKLSEGLLRIGSSFEECSSLKEISIPNTVERIYDFAFYNSGLNRLIIEDGNQQLNLGTLGSSGSGDFSPFWYTQLEYVYIGRSLYFWNQYFGLFDNTNITEVVIGSMVESLPSFDNLKIRQLTIPASVKTLCLRNDNIEELLIEDSEIALDWWAGSELPNLKNLYYGRNLNIQQSNKAFSECTEMITLTIGEYVNDLYHVSFAGDLQTIYNYSKVPATLSESPFNSRTFLNATLFVPSGSLDAYTQAEVWKNFWDIKEWDSAGINDVQSEDDGIKVVSKGIICTSGGLINVFSINGGIVYSNRIVGGEFISLDSGIYVIQHGKGSKRIIIK